MSRRAKLIITALFLVLLAIVVVQVVITWSPQNPLRFRIVAIQGAPFRYLDYSTPFEAHIENTSPASIYLRSAQVVGRVRVIRLDDGYGFIAWGGKEDPIRGGEEPIVIPPYSSVRAGLFVNEEHRYEDAKAGRHDAQYFWISSTRDKAATACSWLHDHCPESFHPYLPWVAEDARNITPIEAIAE